MFAVYIVVSAFFLLPVVFAEYSLFHTLCPFQADLSVCLFKLFLKNFADSVDFNVVYSIRQKPYPQAFWRKSLLFFDLLT